MIWPLFVAMAKFFLRFKVEGQENFKLLKGRQYIIIANHRNYLDPFLVCASVPFFHFLKTSFRYMTKPRYIKAFPFIPLFGAYPIYTKLGSIEKSLAFTEELIKKGKNLLIFPEGKLSLDGNPAPARPGIAYLSRKYNLPIIPLAIKGNSGITFFSYFLRKHSVKVNVGKPFYYKDVINVYKDDYHMAEKIMERVNVMLTQI